MKNETIWSKLMIVVMMSLMLVSCGGDDSDDGSRGNELVTKAVGTWMCTSSTDSARGASVDGLMVGKQITINNNGTYTSTASTFGYSGTYTIKGNSITAKSENGDTFVVTVTISGDKMTWNGTASNGTSFHYVFIRES
ncbi:lipocalin family protein [Prevotella sp. tf2-5]|uniref:lipocalin family protein n=1 Tax=Prevotella sp. tf2-5 TaxID=1761889 RepID=UPI0008EBE3BD|nr:lipocalin family protein [Prevotella sp. tf2-5]SFO85458.1 Lipocalin-like domain-containing protein [Prevotella sp. tf2-5]